MIKAKELQYTPKILFILWACGIIITAMTYHHAYSGPFDFEFFWMGILLSGLSLVRLILYDQIRRQYRLIILFILGLTFYLPIIFWSPNYFHFGDEILHYTTSRLIQEQGNLDIDVNFDIAKFYPGISLTTVFLSEFSDTSIFFSGKLLIGIIHSMILIFMYLFFERVVQSERIPIIGAVIYAINSRYVLFDGFFSYESMALPLMVLTLFIFSKYMIDSEKMVPVKKSYFRILGVVSISALVITHHFTSYMLLLFMIMISLIVHRSKLIQYKKDIYIATSLTFVLIFGWMIYNATTGFNYFGRFIRRSFTDILKMISTESTEQIIQREPYWQAPIPYYEPVITKFLYMPLLIILFIVGVYFLKRERRFNNIWIYQLAAYGSIFFISLTLIFNKSAELFVYRSWAFLFIGTSFIIAFALDRVCNMKIDKYLKKICVYSIIVILLVGGVSAGLTYNFRVPKLDINSINVAAGHSAITYDAITTAKWFEKYLGRYNTFYADRSLSASIGGYGIQKPVRADKIFYPSYMNDRNVTTTLLGRSTNYIVVDNRIAKFLAEYKSYFSVAETYTEGVLYGRTDTFPKKRLEKFDESNFIYKIYSNGNINTYKIIRQKIPKL